MKVYIRSGKLSIHKIWKVFKEDGELVDFWDRDDRELDFKQRKGIDRGELRVILEAKGFEIIGR